VTRDKEKEKSKFQAPNNKQAPKSNDPMTQTKKINLKGLSFWTLELGIYLEFGICYLEF